MGMIFFVLLMIGIVFAISFKVSRRSKSDNVMRSGHTSFFFFGDADSSHDNGSSFDGGFGGGDGGGGGGGE
ncbi:hypothetical protein KO561_03150 [Radiobacillus kanasensis]|uniref:hypothetical protein n=1 Tax=Radiobacillus kanasensis TaxID=2844358 RepID=UPI001E561908|nr:hypothetical protein [Radiobacillus kanasensis]UFT99974.1 hypothetical protein KO561_03150 [Radiobacillus kanasensis]